MYVDVFFIGRLSCFRNSCSRTTFVRPDAGLDQNMSRYQKSFEKFQSGEFETLLSPFEIAVISAGDVAGYTASILRLKQAGADQHASEDYKKYLDARLLEIRESWKARSNVQQVCKTMLSDCKALAVKTSTAQVEDT